MTLPQAVVPRGPVCVAVLKCLRGRAASQRVQLCRVRAPHSGCTATASSTLSVAGDMRGNAAAPLAPKSKSSTARWAKDSTSGRPMGSAGSTSSRSIGTAKEMHQDQKATSEATPQSQPKAGARCGGTGTSLPG